MAKVTNTGETATTITHCHGIWWKSYLDKFLKRNPEAFIVDERSIPIVIQPGEEWLGKALQDVQIEKWATTGLLYMGITHSLGKRDIMQRVKTLQDNKGQS